MMVIWHSFGATLVLAILLSFSWTPYVSAQSHEDVPVPEFYGIYLHAGGRLLWGEQVEPPSFAAVRVARSWNPRSYVLREKSLLFLDPQRVPPLKVIEKIPEMPADVGIVVFLQTSGLVSPMIVASKLEMRPLLYLRALHAVENAMVNSWHGAGPLYLPAPVGRGLVAKEKVKFGVKPVAGQTDMVAVLPRRRLVPGVYRLSLGGDILTFFAVQPIAEAEKTSCVDFTFKLGPWVDQVQPCGIATAPGRPTAPPVPVASICSDYKSCLRGGIKAFLAKRWDQSLPYFQKASSLDPSKPRPWSWLGRVHLTTGRYQEVPPMWDKNLQVGGPMVFGVCRERALWCETGSLYLRPKEVSFMRKGKKVFVASPSDVVPLGVKKRVLHPSASFGLRVGDKKYNFDFFPFGVECNSEGKFVYCPEPGLRQQLAVANYISETIPKLASGALAKVVQHSVVPGGKIGQFRHGSLVTKLPSGSLVVAPTPEDATHTHPGVDIVAVVGTPVYPLADGTVSDMIISDRDRDFGSLGLT